MCRECRWSLRLTQMVGAQPSGGPGRQGPAVSGGPEVSPACHTPCLPGLLVEDLKVQEA